MCRPVDRLRPLLGAVGAGPSQNENFMDIVGSDKAERPIVVQVARVALLALMITIAAWLVTNYALDSLGVFFFK